MPLFRIGKDQKVAQLHKTPVSKEQYIQKLCEANLEALLNIRFIRSEFPTGEKHGGRIDTLGIDENDFPVIIEYKRTQHDNIVTQGFFYLDWLTDHRGDFVVAAQETLGGEIQVDWSSPRLILIAESFTKYDTHAVAKMGQNVELKTYRIYHDNLLYIEDLYTSQATPQTKQKAPKLKKVPLKPEWDLEFHFGNKPAQIRALFDAIREPILGLSEADDGIRESICKQYIAYKTSRNFCEIIPQKKRLWIHLDIPASQLDDPRDIVEDCSQRGHWATGHMRLELSAGDDLEYVLSLIRQSYGHTL